MNRSSGATSKGSRRRSRRGASLPQPLPLTGRNWRLFWGGLGIIGLGYMLLGIPRATGFLTMSLAPVLLVVGYCLVIPLALLRSRDDEDMSDEKV